MNKKNIIGTIFIVAFLLAFGLKAVFASSTYGAIDSVYQHAWTENMGWALFGLSEGNVHVSDSELTGYAWGENIGWISLNCSNTDSCSAVDYKVANDGEGNLTGYAWSENGGWIVFNPAGGGVSINSEGYFSGYAWSENGGWISLNCSNTDSCSAVDYKVRTDWRPRSARAQCNNALDDDGDGKIDFPDDPGCGSLADNDETDQAAVIPISLGGGTAPPAEQKEETVVPEEKKEQEKSFVEKTKEKAKEIAEEAKEISEKVSALPKKIKELFTQEKEEKKTEEKIEELVSKEAPLALQGKWNLLFQEPLGEFVLAPLPEEIEVLSEKFPSLNQVFAKLDITKASDVKKLQALKLTLPGLSERIDLKAELGMADFAPFKGFPLTELPLSIKEKIPSEVVFARAGEGLIDFNIELTLTEQGRVSQRINAVSGRTLQLVLKPESPVKAVRGYLVFRNRLAVLEKQGFEIKSILASLSASFPSSEQEQANKPEIEEKMLVLEFEYEDEDKDGIYTASITAPLVAGEYEVISVIEYQDPDLGVKALRMITVVDPEGYIYERKGDKETRVPGAVVSLFWLNPESKLYEIWPAEEFNQENPQITNQTGEYSFLVPEGFYYLQVEAPGYPLYKGGSFQVKEGRGVHQNIELKGRFWFLGFFNWQNVLLFLVIVFLFYNFYRDKIREKLLRKGRKIE